MKIQVLKNEDYKETSNLPKKGTDRATGFDVVVTSDPEIVGTQYENGAYKRIDYIQYKTNLKLAVQKDRQFSNFGYNIKATFDEEDVKDTLKNRYESLMTYLNV